MQENNQTIVAETKPDNGSSRRKKEQVAAMFDAISQQYDFLNHFLSFCIDFRWRKRLVNRMLRYKPVSILDVATGTGDLAILTAKAAEKRSIHITGIDISEGMLKVGREKIRKNHLGDSIELMYNDSENMDFPDNSFDAVCVAFGVRNFEVPQKGLQEFYRVLKPGGQVWILEFSQPKRFPIKQLYNCYFNSVLPLLGRIISKHKKAYSYLPESVTTFSNGKGFDQLLEEAGFKHVVCENLTLGVSTLYSATK